MENVTGKILKVSGPLVIAEGMREANMFDVVRVGEKKLIVRTRADSYTSISEEKAESALNCKAHIVSTDYPPRTDNTDESYVFSFGNRTTVRKVK